jgi:hypothetical protein
MRRFRWMTARFELVCDDEGVTAIARETRPFMNQASAVAYAQENKGPRDLFVITRCASSPSVVIDPALTVNF